MQPEEQKKILIRLRIAQARQCLQSAKILLNSDERSSVNRSYYAIFHAMRSVLAIEGKDFAKHSAVISYFRRNYIKPKIFDISLSDTISDLFSKRSASDYDDFYSITRKEAEELYNKAEQFINQIQIYIQNFN